MTTFYEGNCTDRDSKPSKTSEQIRIENLEKALFTLKGIAQGHGTDPKIYAQNTLDSIGEIY